MLDHYGNAINIGAEVNATPLPNQKLARKPLKLKVVSGDVTRIESDIVYVHTKDPQVDGSDTEIACYADRTVVVTRSWKE